METPLQPVPIPADVQPIVNKLEVQHEENVEKIEKNTEKTDKVESQINEWSKLFSTPIGKIVGGMLVALLAFLSSWVTEKMQPKPAPPAVVPVVVPVAPVVPPVAPVEPPVTPPIVPPVASALKVVIYVTTALDATEVKKLPAEASVHPALYAAGSAYTHAGKSVPLPCAVVMRGNTVLEVAPYTAGGIPALLAKHAAK